MADRVLRDHSQPCKHFTAGQGHATASGTAPWASCPQGRCPGGRVVTAVEGIVTSVGVNTMSEHGVSGPWAHVTIYGDYEPFDTMLVAAIGDSDE